MILRRSNVTLRTMWRGNISLIFTYFQISGEIIFETESSTFLASHSATFRKDQEINNLSNRLEEEESLVASLKKKIKNLEARIEELEGELEAERQARVKVEKQRGDLNRDLEELSSQLDDTGNVAQTQVCFWQKDYITFQIRKGYWSAIRGTCWPCWGIYFDCHY